MNGTLGWNEDDDYLDVTPSPAVLVTLSYNQLLWGDTICELIDNSIDSFSRAKLQGISIPDPRIELFIPTKAEVRAGSGYFMIRDNGPGLERSSLQNALKAGYSANKRFGNLGLFGVGFNIATAKLGRRTTVTTFRESDDFAIEAILDLQEMADHDEFRAPVSKVPKPDGLSRGTIVRVEGWWPEGNPNWDFAIKVASQSQQSILDLLGRRYAAILDPTQTEVPIQLLVYPNPEGRPDSVVPYIHCVWSEKREVQTASGPIPARIEINEVLGNSKRCLHDGVLIQENLSKCPMCNRSDFRTVEHRVRGWVGIQRYDSIDDYGIDLIRNGRTIRTQEKDAFFHWVEDDGRLSKEYPVDDQTGRIVGQIHLDHVPVDFMKQDFERASQEWVAAIRHIRGEQLRPMSWREGYKNESPISKLHQGYKRIRDFGRKSMYMGRWDPTKNKAVRISRDVEQDYFEKFRKRIPGYFDDAEWWKLVESADQPPPPPSEECAICHFRHQPDDEICGGCGSILRGKPCVACGEEIQVSASVCQHCGESQIGQSDEPWRCAYCETGNSPEDFDCLLCGLARGLPSPASIESLESNSQVLDELCRPTISVTLPNGDSSVEIELITRVTRGEIRPVFGGESVPLIADKSAANRISLFIDESHTVFTDLGIRAVDLASAECAQYLYTKHHLSGTRTHSLSALTAQILRAGWESELSSESADVITRLRQLCDEIADRFAEHDSAVEFYRDLPNEAQQRIARAIFDAQEGSHQSELVASGRYLRFAPKSFLADFFESNPAIWFDEIWSIALPTADQVGSEAAESAFEREIGSISRCLRDVAAVLDFRDPELAVDNRATSAADCLERILR